MNKKLYAERDVEKQGHFYTKHLSAMTAENLHSKSDIAAELAHRDMVIEELVSVLTRTANYIHKVSLDTMVPWYVRKSLTSKVKDINKQIKKLN